MNINLEFYNIENIPRCVADDDDDDDEKNDFLFLLTR